MSDTIHTDGQGRPIVELVWTAPVCTCGSRAWKLHYAPEGGLLAQCDGCHTTERLHFAISAEPSNVAGTVRFVKAQGNNSVADEHHE